MEGNTAVNLGATGHRDNGQEKEATKESDFLVEGTTEALWHTILKEIKEGITVGGVQGTESIVGCMRLEQ